MTAKQLAEQILALPAEQQQQTVAVHDHSGMAIEVSKLRTREVYLVSPTYLRRPLSQVLMVE